jgi:hypothetical protein
MIKQSLIETYQMERIPGHPQDDFTGGTYLVHYFWTDARGAERHEAGQYGDNELSEIAECLGDYEASRLRNLQPGQSAVWTARFHGSMKQVLVNRIY